MAQNGASATDSGHLVVAIDDRPSQHQQYLQHQHHHHQQQLQQQQLQQQLQQHQQQQQAIQLNMHNNSSMAGGTLTNAPATLTTGSLTPLALLSGPLHYPSAAAQHMNTALSSIPSSLTPSSSGLAVPPLGEQAAVSKVPIPAIFQGKKLRFGKWTTEEEEYCDLLIRQFENGWMEGCENGCTLRSFLARKLHCAPMRISKKYAGRGIGKMIFLAKTNSTNGVLTMSEAQIAENAVNLRDAEFKFYKSIYPNINIFPIGTRAPADNPVMHPPCFNAMAQFVPTSQPISFLPIQAAATSTSIAPNAAPTAVVQPSTAPTVPGNAAASPWPGLQAPLATAPQAQTTNNGNHINDLHTTLQQSYLNALNLHIQGNTQFQGSVLGQGVVEKQEPATSGVAVAATAIAAVAPSVPQHRSNVSEIPDFLSGFERVAAVAAKEVNDNNNSNARPKDCSPWIPVTPGIIAAGSNSTEQHSPPFTSKSFDEFHRLLGQDLSPLQKMERLQAKVSDAIRIPTTETLSTGVSATATVAAPGQQTLRPINIVPRSDAKENPSSFTADSYALFAQESARAVSEHSAYSLSNGLHRLLAPRPRPSSPPREFLSSNDDDSKNNNTETNYHLTSHIVEANDNCYVFQPALESASAFLSHIYKNSRSNIVSGSETSGSAKGGSGMDSTAGSDNSSNDSDSNSDDGPYRKKLKIDSRGCMI